MRSRWSTRRAHLRHMSSGRIVPVRESWVLCRQKTKNSRERYRHKCPICGAAIISVHMQRGGWVHFEGAKGMERIKHSCLHMGEGLSRKRDDRTPDLFEDLSERVQGDDQSGVPS